MKLDTLILIIIIIVIMIKIPRRKKIKYRREGGGWMDIMEMDDKMKKGIAFEHWVAELLQDLGYKDVQVTPPTADGGRDIDARKGNKYYGIECKCWKFNPDDWRTKCGEDICRSIFGYARDAKHKHYVIPVIITTSYFSNKAVEYAKRNNITLIDRDELIKLDTKRNNMKKDKKFDLFTWH